MDEKKIIQIIADEVERTGIDIAPDVESFKSLVYAIANIFRDDTTEGCDLLQRLCENYPGYNKAQVAKWFSSATRQCRGNVGVGTVIKLARDAARMANVSITIPTNYIIFPQTANKAVGAHEYTPNYNYVDAPKIMPYTQNNHVLLTYLKNIFGEDKTRAALQLYYVGGTYDQKTIFPNVDEKRMCVGGKIISYLPNGHRDKSKGISNIHFLLHQGTQGDQVLFGSHLLTMHPTATVAVVEAQKTAIIMSILMPTAKSNIIWLATGGKGEFNDRMLRPIYNKNVVVFPDEDGADMWEDRTRQLPFANVVINKWYVDEQKGSHRDIADKVICTMNGSGTTDTENLLSQLFPNNDAVITLCKLFDLEQVSENMRGQGWKWKPQEKQKSWLERIRGK